MSVRAVRGSGVRHLRHLCVALAAAVLDVLWITLCFVAGASFSSHRSDAPSWQAIALAVIGLHIGVSILRDNFALQALRSPLNSATDALGSILCAAVALVVADIFLDPTNGIHLWKVASSLALTMILVPLGRIGLALLLGRIASRHFTSEILIVDGPARDMEDADAIDASEAGLRPDPSDPVAVHLFATTVSGVDRVMISTTVERYGDWALMLQGVCVRGEILVPELNGLGPIGIGRAGDTATLVVAAGRLGLSHGATKRLLDIVTASALLVLLLPLLVVVALLIKLDSPGPVLFRQPRIGRGNVLFDILKFRTMRTDRTDLNGIQSAAREDDRTTRIGRILRRTSIDELPQLLNVLQGSMSIVGPRPHALGSRAEEKFFWEIDQTYWHRHCVKPGITGLAQVRGFRGSTDRCRDLTSRLQADMEYVRNRSFWRDIAILAATVRVLIHPRAY